MRIKNHQSGNQYYLTEEGNWVRNFAKPSVPYLDTNNTIKNQDYFIFLQNEFQNNLDRYPWIDSENLFYPKIVIVSDGFEFNEKQNLINSFPKDVIVFGVNGSLNKWKCQRSMNYYIINNPYPECMKFFPRGKNILPKCIASCRTNSKFLSNYKGNKFRYYPVNEASYTGSGSKEVSWQVDDYRNAICAAVGLAYRFGVQKLLLLCCDDVFKEEREGSYKLENGLWSYPQQNIAHGLINGSIFWLKNQEYYDVQAYDHSKGKIYEHLPYIEEEQIIDFLKD
jgi:hypothetical protein